MKHGSFAITGPLWGEPTGDKSSVGQQAITWASIGPSFGNEDQML